jgi:hypothetical protein
MGRPDAVQWEAAYDERRAFERIGVREIVPRPSGLKVVGSKWVFRIKRGPDGSIQKCEAQRLSYSLHMNLPLSLISLINDCGSYHSTISPNWSEITQGV